ncbi:flagellar biosynthesis protein FlaG [Lysinibacillus mangiferihumi]|uniref:Flagellar biosynthesis protein FlaG n=1 Tax=Lysinibacillus mangiferihumi TaxID=1130819 RepID=A0A4U2ZFA3_9BACI|nr:flagellar protein FlaG [Lysinibacillus mangiferihumi]TKI72835.1 flagellar biosynthesis protein FlaG [Lysinibacillus mangiferihumi]
MRITSNADVSAITASKQVSTNTQDIDKAIVSQGGDTIENNTAPVVEQIQDNNDDTKVKLQEAVDKMNQMLEVNHNAAKFKYHEGLDRYYVTVVDRETDEVIKEIPPKRLLDAFYEMQKLFGMIIDEKI